MAWAPHRSMVLLISPFPKFGFVFRYTILWSDLVSDTTAQRSMERLTNLYAPDL